MKNKKGIEQKMKVVLYSTHCPKCNVLTKKLINSGIEYSEINDISIMQEKGYMTVPILEVDDKSMDFAEANNWINNITKGV